MLNFQKLKPGIKQGWIKSFNSGLSQDNNGNYLPWMTYTAIEFLEKNLKKTDNIFEFGCGTSTLFFNEKVKRIISLETRPIWFDIIKNKLLPSNNNWLNLDKKIEEQIDDIFYHQKGCIILLKNGQENDLYENFVKETKQKFDFIIIDSLKRFLCLERSINFLTKNGILLVDDSERKSYKKIFTLMKDNNFIQRDFPGIAPGQFKRKNTTIFSRIGIIPIST